MHISRYIKYHWCNDRPIENKWSGEWGKFTHVSVIVLLRSLMRPCEQENLEAVDTICLGQRRKLKRL